MTTHWNLIAECLRHELADYGGLLNLLEQQQRQVFAREADAVMQLAAQIEQQAQALAECRKRREAVVSAFAREHGAKPSSTLRSLLPLIERDARPLLEALINEVNLLLHRVRRTSRHNHTLLARAVEIHQEALQALRPDQFTQTYSAAGRASFSAAQPAATLHAAG